MLETPPDRESLAKAEKLVEDAAKLAECRAVEGVEELVKRLRIKADMIEFGERIAFGSDSKLMREAADRLEQNYREVAQGLEQGTHNAVADGSIPSLPTNYDFGFHIDRDDDGFEIVITHAVQPPLDHDEKWIRYDIYERLCKPVREINKRRVHSCDIPGCTTCGNPEAPESNDIEGGNS